MEQRIDPNTQPAYAAGTDPAYIPGLTAPRATGKADEEPERTEEPAPEDAVPEDAAPAEAEAASEGAESDGEAVAEAADDEEDEDEKANTDEDGPAFEVSDRRGSITADRAGIRFTLDDQEADFRWDEIGAVELKPARFGRRFTITVHMSSMRWFNAEVEAAARSSLKEWTEGFDAVLDAYFEES
ncbi:MULTISPECIES: hypothetical protein [unclassified Streptomyces]|uniref:hypothetical protein n=1 Tax=unclassified Streptomyces TaxID=2593676 RepID=UPI00093ADAD9|nr:MULTISPECIES: hypothetical protein [unclassified Streptomyces]OKK21275.1 hypothetical protein AMK09_12300 [Streptomyces sp. CB02488]